MSMKNLSVLIVEDSELMIEVIMTILSRFEISDITVANDGEHGFTLFQRVKPDIVITDWHMEPVDGLEMIKWIRRSKHSVNRSVPIILTTGFSEKIRVTQARDMGVTEILIKPFTANDLAKRLMHVIDKPRDFIESDNYFGPDRRRRSDEGFAGDNRRKENPKDAF